MKDVLVRASDLIGRPVVTLRGDQVGEVQDVVLGLSQAVLVGFTLRNPGFLGGPRKESVPWESVHAVGPDAVMIPHEDKVAERKAVPAGDAHATTDIPVITEAGDEVGRVTDVVLVTGTPTQIVGFEVEAGPAMPSKGQHVLIPFDAMTAASAQAVVVPAEALQFVQDDLAGFGASVEQFRAALKKEHS